MMRRTILLAVVLGVSMGTFCSVCAGGQSEQTVAEASTATAEAAIDANGAAAPADEHAGPAPTGETKTSTDEKDADQPVTAAGAAFDPNSDPNLVAWWKLDGDATDSSGNNLDGKPVGEPAWTPGRIGGAVQLDGADDYVDCGNPPQLAIRAQLTVACWVKIEAFTRSWETILAKGDTSYRLSRSRGASRTAHFACDGTEPPPAQLNGGTVLADDRWHHVAGVFDGSNMILYVDGREEARKPASGPIAATEHPFLIGENAEATGRFLRGLVDDVRVYNRALKPEEIETLVGPYVEAGASEDDTRGRAAVLGEPQAAPAGTRTSRTTTLLLIAGMAILTAGLIISGVAFGRGEQGPQQKSVWQIAQKEFLLNLMTFKFAAGTIVCIVLTGVFVPMLAKDYQQRRETYLDNVARNEADLQTVKVYKNVTPTAFRPPAVLSVFSEGLEKRIGDSATIELDKIPQMTDAAAQGNPYQSVFPLFDASLVFKVVLSILALLVAYDAIAGERERGTLRLILSGAIRRHQVLLAKLLAGLLVLTVPITITFVVGLLLLLSFPTVSLTASDWGRIALMYVATLVFVSAMYNVGLLFSCLTRRSATALMLGLFFWILAGIVVPNGSVYLAAEMRPPEPQEEIDARMASLRQDHQSEWDARKPRAPSNVARSDARDAFGRGYLRLLNRSYLEYLQVYYRLRCPLDIGYADRFWEVELGYLNSLYRQKRLADGLARISPISLYDAVMSSLAGTDTTAFQRFVDAVRSYRARIVEYVHARTEGFSSPAFFTPCTDEEVDEYEKLIAQSQQARSQADVARLMQAAKERWEKAFADTPSLDLRDFPTFKPPGALGNVARAVPDLALLILVNLLSFALAFVAFMKYDVR